MSAILMEIKVGADFNFPAGKEGLRRSQTTIFKSRSTLIVNEPEVQRMRDNRYACSHPHRISASESSLGMIARARL